MNFAALSCPRIAVRAATGALTPPPPLAYGEPHPLPGGEAAQNACILCGRGEGPYPAPTMPGNRRYWLMYRSW